MTERDEKLYFVRETKSTLDSEERRTKENQKILCGRKHFETLEVDFDVTSPQPPEVDDSRYRLPREAAGTSPSNSPFLSNY